MALVRFSRRAEADLLGIVAYTLRTWGEDQATRYVDDLVACCQRLTENSALEASLLFDIANCDFKAHGTLSTRYYNHDDVILTL